MASGCWTTELVFREALRLIPDLCGLYSACQEGALCMLVSTRCPSFAATDTLLLIELIIPFNPKSEWEAARHLHPGAK